MDIRKKVALIYGGDSSEAEVSVNSGKNVASCIDKHKYAVYEILLKQGHWRVLNPDCGEVPNDYAMQGMQEITSVGVEVDKTDFSFCYNGEKIKFDLAYIMIHGTPGEDGLLQGYFEMLGIPHNTCSAFVAALTFDKHSCKRFLDFAGIKLAKDVFLRRGSKYSSGKIIEELGLPVFVKPTNGGSSFGVTKVKREEDLQAAVELVFKEYDSAIIEECIVGREVTNGIYMNKGELVKLPVTEIVTDREFFDYEAKYLGESKEICPADIADELRDRITATSELIYNYMGCKGLVRMDYIISGNDIYFLEMNAVPGMTPMSLIPGQVRAAGIPMEEFCNTLIENIE